MSKSIKPKIAISSLPKSGWWPNGITAYEDNDMMSNGAYPNQTLLKDCLLYTSPSPRDLSTSRMPSSA